MTAPTPHYIFTTRIDQIGTAISSNMTARIIESGSIMDNICKEMELDILVGQSVTAHSSNTDVEGVLHFNVPLIRYDEDKAVSFNFMIVEQSRLPYYAKFLTGIELANLRRSIELVAERSFDTIVVAQQDEAK